MNKQKFAASLEKAITGFSLSKDGLTIDQLRQNPPKSSSVGFTIRLTDGSFFLVSVRKPSDEINDHQQLLCTPDPNPNCAEKSREFVEDTTNLVKLTEGLLFLVSDLADMASGSNSKLLPGEGAEMVMLANLAAVKVRNHIEKHNTLN